MVQVPPSHAAKSKPTSLVEQIIWAIFLYSFGLFNWCLYLILALRSGSFFKKDSEQDQLQFAIARDQYWNLQKEPVSGFSHAFYKLRNGKKLHYVHNNVHAGNLVVLLHGFPDTYLVWRHVLKEPGVLNQHTAIVAVDLPGYGGSDGFDRSDTVVLEAIAEFIVAMRERHEQYTSDFETYLFAHDWGCVIAYRLAAEAPQLADRFIVSNAPHISLALANKDRVLMSASKIFKQYKQNPTNLSLLRKSCAALKPLAKQTLLFGYIFAFHLPSFLVKYLGTGGNFAFLRGALQSAYRGPNKSDWNLSQSLAASLGPGVIEVTTKTPDGETYPESIHNRAENKAQAFYSMTAFYRDGLATQPWEKSLELVADLYNLEQSASSGSKSTSSSGGRRRSSSSAGLLHEHYPGSMRAPVTVVWGEKDIAVGREICLDGIGDYLCKGSEVILLPRAGHWVPIDREGRRVLAEIIRVLCQDNKNVNSYLFEDIKKEYEGCTLLVRK